ncbi:MAG: hypothetical protein H6R14_1450 [Proteobacteria bacterium]|nr:hypothetical protein [Pseudomonadota bacterium]
MKKIIAGLLIAVTLSGCFPVFVPVHGHGHGHHHYRDGHYNRH